MRSTWLGIALFVASACASAGPAPAVRFTGSVPLQVTVRGSLYTGTAILNRSGGEAVEGTFTLKGPVEVKGTLAGRVTNTDIALELLYDIPQNGCKGTMRLSGPTDQTMVEGAVDAQDSCVGRMTGTFKLGPT
jgi:hypothetical protein